MVKLKDYKLEDGSIVKAIDIEFEKTITVIIHNQEDYDKIKKFLSELGACWGET